MNINYFQQNYKDKYPDRDLVFIGYKKPYLIIDTQFGICKMRPNDLLTGKMPCIKSSIDKNQYFINQSKSVHGNKYTYERVNYIGNKIKVQITCSKHESFFQRPNCHLSGKGCPECKSQLIGDLSRKPASQFINDAKIIHDNKYDYSLVAYANSQTKVKLICPDHGLFKIRPSNHLLGQGCPECGRKSLSNTSGWSKSAWSSGIESKHFSGFKFYIIKCTGNNESFYKVGRTFNSIKKRFSSSKMPYKLEVIKIIEGDCNKIFSYESFIKSINKNNYYEPKIKFRGKHECFSTLLIPNEDFSIDYYIIHKLFF